MKIIKLTMNAFSTYHNKTEIDFESMINHGIYLICGATGAGKTTIFDAITFALYGQASGSDRKTSHFRSDFAHPHEETYVELVFEHHQKIYIIKRSPKYAREGYKTEKQATAFLTYDGKTLEGVNEVDTKINELLGVDVHQFKQIVMIAQGEFTKLIYASSREREKVLRHLFHTETFVVFEELLKEKTKELKDDYLFSQKQLEAQFLLLQLPHDFMSEHQNFHSSYIDEATKENEEILKQHLFIKDEYDKQKLVYEEIAKKYYQLQKYNQDVLVYQDLKKEYNQLFNMKDEMKVLSNTIEKMRHIQNHQKMIYEYQTTSSQWQDLNKKYNQVKEKQIRQQITYQNYRDLYETLPLLQTVKQQKLLDIHKNQDFLEKQKQYYIIQKKYQKVYIEMEKIQKQYDELLQKNESFSKRMERDQENVNRIPTLQFQLEQMEQLMKESNDRRIAIHKLSDMYDESKEIQDKHYELSQTYAKVHQNYLTLFSQYQQEDEKFKHQQAGILALSLKDNEPCPVCGSLHHPQLAVISDDVLSSRELEKMLKQLEQKKKEDEEAYQDVLLQNERIQSIQAKLSLIKEQLHIDEQLSKEVFIYLLSDITQITKKQKKNYQKQYVELEYLNKIKKSLQQDQIILENNKKQLENFIEQKHDLEKELTKYQTDIEHLSSVDLTCDYQNLLLLQQKEYKELETKIETIETHYHESQNELASLSHLLLDLEKEIVLLKKDAEDYKEKFNEFIKEYFESYDIYENYLHMMKTFDEQVKQLQDYELKSQSLKSQLELYKDYKDKEIIDLSKEKQHFKDAENLRDELFNQANEQQYIYQNNKAILQDLEKSYKKNQKLFDDYTMYQDLYDYTSGKNPQRLSFERYVLSAYFEHILEYANMELLKMSQGRFALYRKQDAKGARQQGLELMVLDYETGMMRDIQSLSGGESFKAALSLALGLSSMIQSYAGGIELNTLFIDEGFGSLDSESIDKALNVLLDLKNDQKVIGIISHVSELKEKISTQIIVEKSHDGSILHIEKE